MADELVVERKTGFWGLLAPPAVWAAHFLLSYGVASVYCAKLGADAGLSPVRWFIAGLTGAAFLGLAVLGLKGRALWRSDDQAAAAAPELAARQRFIGATTLLLTGLAAFATLLSALVAVFVSTCG